jgi:hypothetical protein
MVLPFELDTDTTTQGYVSQTYEVGNNSFVLVAAMTNTIGLGLTLAFDTVISCLAITFASNGTTLTLMPVLQATLMVAPPNSTVFAPAGDVLSVPIPIPATTVSGSQQMNLSLTAGQQLALFVQATQGTTIGEVSGYLSAGISLT